MVTGSVTNSIFYNNELAIAAMGTSQPAIHNNLIFSNEIGIQAGNSTVLNPTTQITDNIICGNTFNVKAWTADTYVLNNCWCLEDSAEIAPTIYDFFEDSSLGIVFYVPYTALCESPTTGVAEVVQIAISASPNPFSDQLRIRSSTKEHTRLRLLNLSAQQVFEVDFDGELIMDTSTLPSGLYLYQVFSASGYASGKVVKH
jgi:hypothetical protein